MIKKRGFTLVEIIFSIAFLSIVSVVILQLFITSDELAQRAQIKNFATLYASNAIELAKAQANANELPKSAQAEIEQYFDSYWRRTTSPENAVFRLKLTMTKDVEVQDVIHFSVVVINQNAESLARIDTAHYLQGGAK